MAFQAFLIALIIFVGKADYFVGTAMLGRPLVLGMLVGIALGDVSQGVIIGFQLELVFMGMQAIGASIPPDMIVGSVLGTAFAISTGNGIDTAVTIAMPAAILSAFVVNLFYGVITPLMARTADKFAAEDNDKGISAVFLANGFLFDVTFGVIGFVAFMFGGDAVSAFVASIPAWLTAGITIATGILPALGFAQLVTMIASKETAVFLLLGFVLAAYLGVPVLGIVCFAVVIVGILFMAHIFMPSQGSALMTEGEDDIAAYQRHLEFYNCHTTMQPLIGGIVCAMEEENANNEEFDTSSISSMKVALMGPLAGIGDSLIGGTLRIIATGIAGGLCMAGSPFGPLLFLLIFNAVNIALRCLGVKYGYGLGENIISKVSDPSTMQKLTCALSIVGLMVIGGMIATNVAITTPIAFDISGTAFSLQDTLDSIFPKLLPVAAFGILYVLNKKGVNVLAQIIAIMVLGVALGAVGILG